MVNGKVNTTGRDNVRPDTGTVQQGPYNSVVGRPPGSRRAWDIDQRRQSQIIRQSGEQLMQQQHTLRQQWAAPALRTIREHTRCLNVLGHLDPFRHTGNKRSEVLTGVDLVLLACQL